MKIFSISLLITIVFLCLSVAAALGAFEEQMFYIFARTTFVCSIASVFICLVLAQIIRFEGEEDED